MIGKHLLHRELIIFYPIYRNNRKFFLRKKIEISIFQFNFNLHIL